MKHYCVCVLYCKVLFSHMKLFFFISCPFPSQSFNHWIMISQPLTTLLSSSLTPANRSYPSHVFPLRPSLISTTPLLCGVHLRDKRDRTSTLPFRVSLPRMLQLCHLHGRVWTSHWRTRVWLWIIHLGDTERKKIVLLLSFFLPPCLSFSTRWCAHEFVSSLFKSHDVVAACSMAFEVLCSSTHDCQLSWDYWSVESADRLVLSATLDQWWHSSVF